MTNGLLTDLGLNIPPKFFFENFIDDAFQLFIDNTLLKRSIFHSYLSYFHRQIQDIKGMKQAACLTCRKPCEDAHVAYVSIVTQEHLGFLELTKIF